MNASLPLVDDYMFVDNSFLSALQECPYSLLLSRLHKRISANIRSGMLFGGFGHKLLEMRYKSVGHGVPGLDLEDRQMQLLQELYTPNVIPEDDFRQQNWAAELFVRRYNAKYLLEPFTILFDAQQRPFVEVPFGAPLTEHRCRDGRIINVIHTGRIDMVVMEDHKVFIMDHKTSSILGQHVYDEQRSSAQFPGYMRGFYATTGIMPIGFIVNYIRTREAPVKPKGGIDTWWDENFHRQTEYVSEAKVAEWQQNACEQVEEFFWRWENDRFTQHRKSCVLKYGKCQFYELCELNRDQHMEMLSSNQYTDNNWSPLEHN